VTNQMQELWFWSNQVARSTTLAAKNADEEDELGDAKASPGRHQAGEFGSASLEVWPLLYAWPRGRL